MCLFSELSCEAGSFSCCLTPRWCFQSEALRLYFPTLEPWVAQSVSFPSCSSQFVCTHMWDHPLLQPPPCHTSSPPLLPASAPLTSLYEYFLFNSLVVGLPYSLIFCRFWGFFVFKFVVVLLVVQGGTVYLPMPPSWPEIYISISVAFGILTELCTAHHSEF